MFYFLFCFFTTKRKFVESCFFFASLTISFNHKHTVHLYVASYGDGCILHVQCYEIILSICLDVISMYRLYCIVSSKTPNVVGRHKVSQTPEIICSRKITHTHTHTTRNRPLAKITLSEEQTLIVSKQSTICTMCF